MRSSRLRSPMRPGSKPVSCFGGCSATITSRCHTLDRCRGCHELRIVDQDATWRIVYFVDRDAVVILEVFSKKSRQTPKKVIDTYKKRLATYRDARSPGK